LKFSPPPIGASNEQPQVSYKIKPNCDRLQLMCSCSVNNYAVIGWAPYLSIGWAPYLVNQPHLSLFDECGETTVGHQISIMKRKTKTKNEWTQNMVKKMYRWSRMPMYTD